MSDSERKIVFIGYSQHACVVADILASQGRCVDAYCDRQESTWNPLGLSYLGSEEQDQTLRQLRDRPWFVPIGDNVIRERVTKFLLGKGLPGPATALHRTAVLGSGTTVGVGTMVGVHACINAHAHIGVGVICNSSSTVEHNCQVGDFAHVGPGAVLAGGVIVGGGCLIGANAVIAPRVKIGRGAVVGAGAVVLRDVPDNVTIVGNPGKIL